MIGLNKTQRALFILSEPYTYIFNILKIDKLLRISRAICRYRFLKGSCGSVFYNFVEEMEIMLNN